MRLSQICIAITQLARGAGAWSPLALWPGGIATPGMWISPRTLTSQWQDYTGTTPVVEPGTVADSANPVGLALDLRSGNPVPLGPELVDNLAPAVGVAVLVGANTYELIGSPEYMFSWSDIGQEINKTYLVEGTISNLNSNGFNIYLNGISVAVTSNGDYSFRLTTTSSGSGFNCYTTANNGTVISFFVREVPGNHMLQSTSTSRPLLSAYDGQTLGPGNTYDSAGYPVFQLYDGVDDGMATAAFSAGTLIDGMDCMIVVRRDAGTLAVAGLNNQAANIFFGIYNQGDTVVPTHQGCGTTVPYVDGVELTGGTSATRDTLYNALTAGNWHILEYRNLNLSAWTKAEWGNFGASFFFNGPRGDILLYPSTASTEDKDAARQWLADYYGVTLP